MRKSRFSEAQIFAILKELKAGKRRCAGTRASRCARLPACTEAVGHGIARRRGPASLRRAGRRGTGPS